MTRFREGEESAQAEARRSRRADEESESGQERAFDGGPPRLVVALGIAVAVGAILLLVVLHLTGVLGPGAH